MTRLTTLMPKLRFPGFTDPWAHAPLSKVLTEHKIKNTAGRDVFSVSMEFGIVNQIELLGRSFAAADTSHYTIGRRYDVVYTKSPLKAFPFGIVKQSKFDGEVALSPLYGVFTPSNQSVGLMIEAYFESPNRSKAFLSPLCQKGAKNTLQITNTTFLSGRLPLPTQPAEQQKIAECLSTLDELIGAERRKLDALKAHKKGLMQQLFPREGETLPRLRFPEFHSAPEWEEKQIGDLKPFVTSGSRGWAEFYADQGELFVRITNLSRESIYLDLEDSKFVKLPASATEGVRTQLREHDVLISITADIGIIGYVDASVPSPAYINQHIALVRFGTAKLFRRFVAYFLAAEQSQKLFRASTDTGTKAGMNLNRIQKIKMMLPTPAEQYRIATCLSSLDELIAAQSDRLSALRTHKQGLLQQLFPAPADADA